MREELRLAATTENLGKVLQLVAEAAAKCGFTEERSNEIQVAAEESFVNIVRHAYDGDGDCWVECRADGDTVVLTMIDSGVAFDPVAAAAPNTDGAVADRPIGGLGILLVKQFTDELSYRREGDTNVLVLTARRRDKE